MSTLNDKNFSDSDILIVDDDAADIKLLVGLLSEAGYEVRPATSGELALRSVQAKLPALILLDIKMPNIDGYEVCRRLKADEKTRSIPVIFTTGLDDEKEKVMGLQAGGVDYICKPIQKEEMLARVRTHLALRRAQLELIRSNTELSELNTTLTDDITERKQAEQNFQNSLDNSPLGVRILTAEGELLYANQAILDIYGYSSFEELKNTPTKQHYTPESYAEHRKRVENRKLGRSVPDNYEIGIVRKNGEVRHLQVLRREIVWNGKKQFQVLYQDITERKQAEEALRESERKYRSFIESSHEVIFSKDRDGHYHTLNLEAVIGLGGTCVEDVDGKTDYDLLPKEQADALREVDEQLIESGKPMEVEEVVRNAQGENRIYLSHKWPIFDDKGRVANINCLAIDITERKQAEEQILHLNLVLRAIRNVNQLITREKDCDKLIQGVCDTLVETRGYYNTWIALLDESGKLVTHGEAGLGKDFLPMVEKLRRGELTTCARKALGQPEIVLTKNPPSTCADCPLAKTYGGRGAVTVRLEAGDKIFGVLSASIPIDYIYCEEEVTLFKEVSRDVAMALQNIEFEKERKRAEDALRESQEFNSSLLSNSPHPIMVINPDTSVKYINPALEQLTGFSSAEVIGRKFPYPWWIEEMMQKNSMDLKEAMHQGVKRLEKLFQKKNGELFWVEITSAPIIENGVFKYYLPNWVDITERKQIEEDLKRYQYMVESATDAIFFKDLESRYVVANAKTLEAFGLSRKEVVGKNDYRLLSDRGEAKKNVEDDQLVFKTGKPTKIVKVMTSASGERYWFEAIKVPQFDHRGNIIGLVGIARDITERKRAEETLEESEERFRAIAETASEAIISTDNRGNIVYWNRAAKAIFGYSADEVIGKLITIIIPEQYRELFYRGLEEIVSSGSTSLDGLPIEIEGIRKDGSIFPCELSLAALEMRGENFFTAIVHDLTERKRLQVEQLRTEKLESVGTLAGGIAHDFNNILTGIMGNIGLARRYVEPKSKAEERLVEAEKASLRARDLTQQLLTFARGGAPIKKTIPIAELIRDSATFALRGSNVRCQFSLPDDLWHVEADEGQINQVITNLVINADEAMPEGGVLNIGAKNSVVKTSSTLPLPQGNYIQITIEDQGVGISKEHLRKIFEPYFTTKQKGSGLGLATAYSIINNHCGNITVDSELTVGTTFYIYLPASKKRMPRKEKEAAEQPALLGRGRIMVMDDEEIIRQLLDDELTDVGYEVELTVDGAEAIEQYRKAKESGQSFDAVILDLTVPGGMGGKDVIKKLLEIDPNVKAIVSSGYSTDPIMADFKDYGFSGVAAKPYEVEQLEKILHTLLKNK